MKIRVWIAFAVAAIAFTVVISLVVLASHALNRILQMSLKDEYITTGISVFTVTLGIVLGLLFYFYTKQKR
jgi:uncharacterized membrane protein HdeD (DUF308 family)